MGKKKILAAFLEKDNLKMLVYEGKSRVFAGQITFDQEVLRDAFIADASKFNSQVKIAFAQKPALHEVADVVLFLPPDKTFTKTLDASDSVDGFIQSLPYFKEELILSSQQLGVRGKGTETRVTHVAFEKKLVEDLQRPFLESGKAILAVRSTVADLVAGFPAQGDYFLLLPFEKEIAFAVASDGTILEASGFKPDLFVTRFGEYVTNHNLGHIRQAYTLGVFPSDLAEKLHHAHNLTLTSLESADIYDLVVSAFTRRSRRGLAAILSSVDLSALTDRFPGQQRMFLVGAAVVGIILVVAIVKNADRLKMLSVKNKETVSPVATAPTKPVAPEPKPADYKVRVLNGTLVEGEGGRLADKLKALGFDVVETKNATSAGFVATRLRVTAGVPQKIIDSLTGTLSGSYSGVVVEPMASDSAKIEIIIGAKKS